MKKLVKKLIFSESFLIWVSLKKLPMNSFLFYFNIYCPPTWMLYSRTMHNKVHQLHENSGGREKMHWKHCIHCIQCIQWHCIRCIQWQDIIFVYSDKTSSFAKLLEKDGSITIHAGNLQTVATEILKVYKTLSPAITVDLFHVRQSNYNLRHNFYFAMPNVKSLNHGTESLSNLGPRLWNLVSDKVKQLVDVYVFKK